MTTLKDKMRKTKLNPDQIAVFYLGQVGFVIKYQGKYILIDGYLTDYVDRTCTTEVTVWKRLYDAPMKAEELDFIDYVFCTHSHYDHCDPETLLAIEKASRDTVFLGPKSVCDAYRSYGIEAERIREMKTDCSVLLSEDISVTAIPAAHEELHPDGFGSFEEVGYVFALGKTKLFHAGDCCIYDGLEERVQGVDIMMLPINGRDYYRLNVMDIVGNMNCREAVMLAKRCGTTLLVPTHFDLYGVNELNPIVFLETVKGLNPTQEYHIFAPGEKYIFG